MAANAATPNPELREFQKTRPKSQHLLLAIGAVNAKIPQPRALKLRSSTALDPSTRRSCQSKDNSLHSRNPNNSKFQAENKT